MFCVIITAFEWHKPWAAYSDCMLALQGRDRGY